MTGSSDFGAGRILCALSSAQHGPQPLDHRPRRGPDQPDGIQDQRSPAGRRDCVGRAASVGREGPAEHDGDDGLKPIVEATKSAQRAGIDHKRLAQPSAYLGRKPSYDRATFDRIRLALDSASPPSLSAIATAEGLSKQAVFRLKQEPQAALDAWGL
jgi:hypothetical protein